SPEVAAGDVQIRRDRCGETNAIRDVERLRTNLKALVLSDLELPGYRLVPLPEARALQGPHGHVAVRAKGGLGKGGRIQAIDARRRAARLTFRGRRRIGQNLIGTL